MWDKYFRDNGSEREENPRREKARECGIRRDAEDGMLQDGIIQDRTVQDGTVQDGTVQGRTAQDETVQNRAVQDATIRDENREDDSGREDHGDSADSGSGLTRTGEKKGDDGSGDGDGYENFCYLCHRPESVTGELFRLPNNISICSDCMRRTMDTMNQFDYNDILKNVNHVPNMPNISFLNLSDLQGMTKQQKVKKKKVKEEEEPAPKLEIRDIPRPHKIKASLDEYVVGQEFAKKVISVAVYNHYKRVAADAADDIDIEKSNVLLIGPTGCGKTYLVRTLAKLLDVPLAITDATSLTEAGYIGDDIESVVSKLLAAADNDVEKAQNGIIFIDEIDKIAKKHNTTSRDVSGESVQQGMLKLLEGAEVEVPVGANSKNAMVPLTTVNTKNILFICGGAFPDLEEIIKQRLRKQTSIGFSAELKDKYDKEKNILKKVTVEDLKKFGMIPEFIGRLPIICPMEGLSESMMIRILKEPKNAILKQYQKLLTLDEVDLQFDESALAAIAKKAMEKDVGARALRAIIEEFMLDIMYEIPKDDNIGRVTITGDYILGTGGPVIELRGGTMSFDERKALKPLNSAGTTGA